MLQWNNIGSPRNSPPSPRRHNVLSDVAAYVGKSEHIRDMAQPLEAFVKRLLAQTDEWPVVSGCPNAGREVSPDTLLRLVEYRAGPSERKTAGDRWLEGYAPDP
jgi:hypothetical protein